MTEYELDQICSRIDCDCKCMKCPYMEMWQRSELGLDEYDEEYESEYEEEDEDNN